MSTWVWCFVRNKECISIHPMPNCIHLNHIPPHATNAPILFGYHVNGTWTYRSCNTLSPSWECHTDGTLMPVQQDLNAKSVLAKQCWICPSQYHPSVHRNINIASWLQYGILVAGWHCYDICVSLPYQYTILWVVPLYLLQLLLDG